MLLLFFCEDDVDDVVDVVGVVDVVDVVGVVDVVDVVVARLVLVRVFSVRWFFSVQFKKLSVFWGFCNLTFF